MRRFSKKRAKQNRLYLKLREKFLQDNDTCRAGLPGCTGVATQCHHMEGRTSEKLLDVSTWLPVCHNCHSIIEHEPVMAKENGFSRSRLKAV